MHQASLTLAARAGRSPAHRPVARAESAYRNAIVHRFSSNDRRHAKEREKVRLRGKNTATGRFIESGGCIARIDQKLKYHWP
jgi:hypothetical protein